jgi:hypothetical protein
VVAKKFVNQYSWIDRALHKIAFASKDIQVALADLEDRVYRQTLSSIDIRRPVFVTALPRAGTTILLNMLHNTGEFVSHTYMNMPFVLCPVIWRHLRNGTRSYEHNEMERAHGDGITISVGSPEAFEEMIWNHFWRSHYGEDRIEPWRQHQHAEFVSFLQNHIRKQLLLANRGNNLRYLSKNNLNISRITYLPSVFPDATVVVLFRPPLQHASSLLKQHLNFLKAHVEDDFSRAYMRGIGHFDFGANFLPVNFNGWLQGDRRPDATGLAFWVEYWVAAYRYVLDKAGDSVRLLSFEQLTQDPQPTLRQLADDLQLAEPDKFVEQFTVVRSAPAHDVDDSDVPASVLAAANELNENLLKRVNLDPSAQNGSV